MNTRTLGVLAGAGLLVAAGSGCSSMNRSSSNNPTAQQVTTPQKQAQEALQRANDAQKKASDQEQKAAEAQADVQKIQQQLVQARNKARQEQQKAEQLQNEANRETQMASQQAQQSQRQAVQGLQAANEHLARNQLTTRGHVTQSSQSEVVVQPQSGQPMKFKVTDQTNVLIDGQQASASDIRQGEDALVSYEVSGVEPTARTIQVVTGNLGLGSQGSRGSGQSQGNQGLQEQGTGTGSYQGNQGTSSGSSQGTGSQQ